MTLSSECDQRACSQATRSEPNMCAPAPPLDLADKHYMVLAQCATRPWPWLVEVQILPGPRVFGSGVYNLFSALGPSREVRLHASPRADTH